MSKEYHLTIKRGSRKYSIAVLKDCPQRYCLAQAERDFRRRDPLCVELVCDGRDRLEEYNDRLQDERAEASIAAVNALQALSRAIDTLCGGKEGGN